MAVASILQRTGKETLERGDFFPPYIFLKSHWTCPSKLKISCYNPQQQGEVLVFKDSRKQSIPFMSESKKEKAPGKDGISFRVHTDTNTKDSHTGYLPAVYMCRASFMTAQTVASIIWF